jgi:(1->4)-alpha-D-glucan 1-alpha-D-glucosylmutase
MTALSTHDTKRGEDVRARIGVLSQVPSLWAEFVRAWEQRTPSPDPVTGLFLWQNIFGVWPVDGVVTDELRGRLHAYAEKAIREAALHTTWNDPDADFEPKVHSWIDDLIDGPLAVELTKLLARLDEHARSDGLGQKLIQLTAPGVPDVYQGTELWDDSLVDPDNRRPVDFAARREALSAQRHPKMRVVTAALRLRREKPDVFTDGDYTPLLAEGSAAGHVVAFVRGADVLTAATRHSVLLGESGWGDTLLRLPEGTWKSRFGPAQFSGAVSPGDLFSDLPVALLERVGD